MSPKTTAFQLQLTYIALAVLSLASCASLLPGSRLDEDSYEDSQLAENSIAKVLDELKANPEIAARLEALTAGQDQEEKRSFSPWGGKRSFNPWGGKRSSLGLERRAFQAWGGKRSFNPWGGKRTSTGQLDDRYGVKRVFNPWGGKRSQDSMPDEIPDMLKRRFQAWGGKRAEFNPWGGKRAEFNPWGGKRAEFNPWGGKRSFEEH